MKRVLHEVFPPTHKQLHYLARLTGIKGQTRLGRYVARTLGRPSPEIGGPLLTKYDFSKAIDNEVKIRRNFN